MTESEFQCRILRFEEAWRDAGSCEIANFLDHSSDESGRHRTRLLVELICIDLEFRWKTCPKTRRPREFAFLEDYAARYSELGPLDQLPLELIGEEYRVRCQWGDSPTHAGFVTRFAARQAEIAGELTRIDRELEAESADYRLAPLAAEPLPASPYTTDVPSDIPWIAHDDVLLRRMIGCGRMGKVYEAWQRSANRSVAVKFLRKSLLHCPEIVERFVGEARIVAKLRHPNIIGIHGLGRTPAGAYFLVMEHVAGRNLDAVGATNPMRVRDAVRWMISTCDALEHAHEKQIIHCDLKPANLLLDDFGRVRVTDFGLARLLSEQMPWTAHIEGTAPFMAPEQACRDWGPIGVHTDVYGVGAVLYTLLTGRPPWVGQRLPDVLAQVISALPVAPPSSLRSDLASPLSDLCLRCLAKRAAERYRSVRELRIALAAMID